MQVEELLVGTTPPDPTAADHAIAPVRALLDAVSGGVKVTAAGFLPPAAIAPYRRHRVALS